jgi:hypothetical protein
VALRLWVFNSRGACSVRFFSPVLSLSTNLEERIAGHESICSCSRASHSGQGQLATCLSQDDYVGERHVVVVDRNGSLSIRRPGGRPRLTFKLLPRRSGWSEAAGRFARLVKCARIWRPVSSARQPQPHFIRGTHLAGRESHSAAPTSEQSPPAERPRLACKFVPRRSTFAGGIRVVESFYFYQRRAGAAPSTWSISPLT